MGSNLGDLFQKRRMISSSHQLCAGCGGLSAVENLAGFCLQFIRLLSTCLSLILWIVKHKKVFFLKIYIFLILISF